MTVILLWKMRCFECHSLSFCGKKDWWIEEVVILHNSWVCVPQSKSHGFGTRRGGVNDDRSLNINTLLYERNVHGSTRSNSPSKSCLGKQLKVLVHRQCVCILHGYPSRTPLPSEASSALFTRSPLLQKRDYPVTNSVSHYNKVRQQCKYEACLSSKIIKVVNDKPPSCRFLVVNSGECNLWVCF